MKELHFTHINEAIRSTLGITRDEYALCNYIDTWASLPKSSGECDRSRQEQADFIGITTRGIIKMLQRLEGMDLVEYNLKTKRYFSTQKWFELTKISDQSSHKQMNKVHQPHEQSSHESDFEVNKVHHTPIYSNKNSNKEEESAPSNAVAHPASEIQLPSIPREVKTPTSKQEGQENKQTEQRDVSTKVKSKFIPFSESLSSPTAATEFKEFLQAYAGGAYKNADAAKYVADALTWATNTPKGVTAKYADWRVALAAWCKRDGVPKKGSPQPQPAKVDLGLDFLNRFRK